MSSRDLPTETNGRNSEHRELHSFTKLAITYLAIGLGLLILFLGAGITTIPFALGLPQFANLGYVLVFGLAILMIVSIVYLRRGKKIGAYLFFASLTIYHLQYIPYTEYLLFSLIPSGVVSGLLLASYKHLK
jgi:hypothetical protein